MLDLCTGTGCIALLLYALLQPVFPLLAVHGVDISSQAVSLARENRRHNIRRGYMPAPRTPGQAVHFHMADVFASQDDWTETVSHHHWDVITCNPPYISPHGFAHDTARSVRNYEPKLAQVPLPRPEYASCRPEDVFYARLLDIGNMLQPQVLLCEVASAEQAARVVRMAQRHPFCEAADVEIWADCPDAGREPDEPASVAVDGRQVTIRGSGEGRAVFIHRRRANHPPFGGGRVSLHAAAADVV